MAEVAVQPGYRWTPTDIVTVDKLNLTATPLVTLSIETPITDQNFLRNGNFYSSFWSNPAGVSCPVGVETQNANYWTVNPNGAAVTCKRSTDVPDLYSLWSLEIDGAVNVTDCSLGQQINGDLSATLRRPCTFSGYIENNSGALLSATLEVWTANAFNNFNTVTLQRTVNLQSIGNSAWGYVFATIDLSLSTILNVANGLLLKIRLPSGTLSSTGKRVNCSRLKFQQGEVATEFSDDPSLFVTSPSVDSTMLQDGCLARSTLYVTNPGVIPKGAFAAGAIQSADIGIGQVEAVNLDPGISTTTSAGFTVPAINSNVAITMTSVTGILPGLVFSIAGAGKYATVSVAGNVVTATNTGASGNAAAGTVINSGAAVSTTGNAVLGCLGYTPVNKAGDSSIGKLDITVDTSVGSGSALASGLIVEGLSANQANDSYFPAIGFNRPGGQSRALGLGADGRLKTVDGGGVVGYLLDSVHQVDTNSYQDASITLQKLATSLVNILIAPGTIHMFAGSNPPSGWFICDGSPVSRTTYANLFSAIGTYWGSGDNVNTFNLPDLRGRAPIGYVNTPVGGITGRSFGYLGGEEGHALSQAEIPSHLHQLNESPHNHTLHDPTHSHGLAGFAISTAQHGADSGYWFNTGAVQTNLAATGITIDPAITGITMNPTGGNGTHNNMQPYAVMYFIIKY